MKKKIKKVLLSEMHKGWFIGNFEPSLLKTEVVEVGVKHYKAGDTEAKHYHKGACEFTVIISGKVQMNEEIYEAGDIVIIEPHTPTDFKVLEDCVTTVVKIPGVPNDKFMVEK